MWKIDSIFLLWLHSATFTTERILPGTAETKSLKWLQVEPLHLSLQGDFYIWPEKICPRSFINYLKSFCTCPRLLLGKHCTNSALGKPFMVRRLQKIVLAGCRGCIWAYAEHIPVGSKHWGCKDVQGLVAVQQTNNHTLLLLKEEEFSGLAKVCWFRNMTVAPLELISAFSFCLLTPDMAFHLSSLSLLQALNPMSRDRCNVTVTQ